MTGNDLLPIDVAAQSTRAIVSRIDHQLRVNRVNLEQPGLDMPETEFIRGSINALEILRELCVEPETPREVAPPSALGSY